MPSAEPWSGRRRACVLSFCQTGSLKAVAGLPSRSCARTVAWSGTCCAKRGVWQSRGEPAFASQRLSGQIERDRLKLQSLTRQADTALSHALARRMAAVAAQDRVLQSLSYKNVLKRGFAVVRDEDGKPLTRAADIASGQAIAIQFADGGVTAIAGEGGVTPVPPPPTAPASPASDRPKRQSLRKSRNREACFRVRTWVPQASTAQGVLAFSTLARYWPSSIQRFEFLCASEEVRRCWFATWSVTARSRESVLFGQSNQDTTAILRVGNALHQALLFKLINAVGHRA